MNMHLSAPYLHDRWDDEVALEQEMLALGKEKQQAKINKARKKGQMDQLRPQRSLIYEWIVPVAEYLEHWLDASAKKRGVKPVALPCLKQVSADTAAVVALRCITKQLGHSHHGLIAMSYEIGTWMEHEARARAWQLADPKGWASLSTHYNKRGSNATHQKRSRISIFNKHVASRIGWDDWTDEQRRRVGLQMIDCVIQATKRFHIVPDPNYRKGKVHGKKVANRPMVLMPDGDLLDWLNGAMDDELVHSAQFLPTLIPPKPWTGPRDGGYWTPYVNTPFLIRFKANHEEQRQRAIDDFDAVDMTDVYSAINAVQDTGWRINTRVLDIVQHCWDHDLAIADLPRQTQLTKPPRPEEAETDEEIRKKWNKEAGEINLYNAKLLSRYMSAKSTIQLAQRMSREPVFYFPHMLDFRGRMYPIPHQLSPQGDDLHRGLLTFAETKKVEPEDAWWLAMQVANTFGNQVDKLGMESRIDWVDERWEELEAIADDPIANRKWTTADDPWQFLAAVFEWVAYQRNKENFYSSLPIRVDGTCNGIQHLSTLIRDEVGGASVNLIPAEKPRDIYQEVADELTKILEAALASGEPEAGTWLALVGGRCPRSLTKRPVMILPYGGTRHSYFDYTMDWLEENDQDKKFIHEDDRFAMVGYLVKKLWPAVGNKVGKARDVMKWLKDCTDVACEDGKPLFWKVPSGFMVRQFYGIQKEKQVETLIDGQRYQLVNLETTKDMDHGAQGRAIAPNFIHSMDASCLCTAVNMAKEVGIHSLTTIHDSYGTVAGNMNALFQCIREAFIENHDRPILEEFLEWCKHINPKAKTWPKMLEMGKLNLEEVRESMYFFA